jgi:hypothetical protein
MKKQTLPAVKQPLSKKKELFVLEYTQNGRNPIQAALAAGYPAKFATYMSDKLMRDPEVKKRIDAVYGKTGSGSVSRDVLSDLYLDAVVASKRLGNTRDLINAVNGLARLHGLDVDRKEIKGDLSFSLSDLIDEFERGEK